MHPRNFSDLDSELAVGGNPESAAQVTSLRVLSGVGAVVSLQSDSDVAAYAEEWREVQAEYVRLGITLSRVPIACRRRLASSRRGAEAASGARWPSMPWSAVKEP